MLHSLQIYLLLFVKRIGSEEPICYFLLRGITTLRAVRPLMRTVRRLRLRCLLFRTICVLLPLSLSHHVETLSSPTKHTVFTLRTSRWVTHHNTLRWRCRESNPGPQCLCYKGITTILVLYTYQNLMSTNQIFKVFGFGSPL